MEVLQIVLYRRGYYTYGMKKHITKSTHPFRINENMEIEFEPITIKEGELPIIPKIWIEEVEE